MSRINASPITGADQLPKYLGFGRLEQRSIISSSEGFQAEYRAGDELVYSVRMSEGYCQLEEFFDGQSLGLSRFPTLEEAFLHQPTLYTPAAHPRLKRILSRFGPDKHIYYKVPKEISYMFYPSGLLFYVYLPVMAIHPSARKEFNIQEGTESEESAVSTRADRSQEKPGRAGTGPDMNLKIRFLERHALLVELEEICLEVVENRAISLSDQYPLLIALAPMKQPGNGRPS